MPNEERIREESSRAHSRRKKNSLADPEVALKQSQETIGLVAPQNRPSLMGHMRPAGETVSIFSVTRLDNHLSPLKLRNEAGFERDLIREQTANGFEAAQNSRRLGGSMIRHGTINAVPLRI